MFTYKVLFDTGATVFIAAESKDVALWVAGQWYWKGHPQTAERIGGDE